MHSARATWCPTVNPVVASIPLQDQEHDSSLFVDEMAIAMAPKLTFPSL